MKASASAMLLFFICLNLSLYLINASGVLPPYESIPPYASPQGIQSQLIFVDLSTGNLVIGITLFAASALIFALLGHIALGGTVGLVLLAADIISPVISWFVIGFPKILSLMGVNPMIISVVSVLCAFPWFWFIFSFISQRQVMTEEI